MFKTKGLILAMSKAGTTEESFSSDNPGYGYDDFLQLIKSGKKIIKLEDKDKEQEELYLLSHSETRSVDGMPASITVTLIEPLHIIKDSKSQNFGAGSGG